MTPTDPIGRLVLLLSQLPGIGEKTATRLAFHIIGADDTYGRELAIAVRTAADEVHPCSICGNLTAADPCSLCLDPRRLDSVFCVVEQVQDLLAIERAQVFRGRYHVLHGALAPLDGIGPDEIRIKELLQRLGANDVQETILALSSTVEGEATTLYLHRLLEPLGIKVTRIASGVPVGGDLEYVDKATLARALEARRDLGEGP